MAQTETSPQAPDAPADSGFGRLSPATAIFWASFVGLFLELALIRWVSSEVRVFAYCKNLVLVASFLGFGTGCFLSRRRLELVRALFALLLLALLVRLPWPLLVEYGPRQVSNILAELSGFMIFKFGTVLPWRLVPRFLFAIGWTTALFFVVAFIMVPFGQIVAAGVGRFESPVRAYSINVAGSLAGILTYTLATSLALSPFWWFVPAVLGCLAFCRDRREVQATAGIGLALVFTFLPVGETKGLTDAPPSPDAPLRVIWSGYQKLALDHQPPYPGWDDAWHVNVNNTGYQIMLEQAEIPLEGALHLDRFNMPYALRRRPGSVLIVGAGSGNDAAVALKARASSVVAVEIDRTIYDLGKALHPQKPYDDERVEAVIDDARHYLKTSKKKFDVIVFSHLDSHTLLSSYTNVRLDNYIYTVEAFQEARERLAPGGLLYVSFYAQQRFVAHRLVRNLEAAFGHAPVFLESTRKGEDRFLRHDVYLLTGEAGVLPEIREAVASWTRFRPAPLEEVRPSTDAWPFLPLKNRTIPPFVVIVSVVIILLSVAFALRARPRGEAFDGRVFWMGAAFLLIETHNVSRLALVFGTTWKVNAWVIGVILGLILLANALYLFLRGRGRRPGRWAVAGLFATLAAAYLVPLELFLAGSPLVGKGGATLLMSAPIFFAGLVFAEAFGASPAPGFALGWNILGAVIGGMAENLSYVWGIPALVPLAALFYAAAILWPWPGFPRRSATA